MKTTILKYITVGILGLVTGIALGISLIDTNELDMTKALNSGGLSIDK